MSAYSAFALVLTAKSIVRLEKFKSDKDFAERYLVGTLTSMIIAIIGVLIVNFIQ